MSLPLTIREANTVEGRLADLLEKSREIVVDEEYRLSSADRNKLVDALRRVVEIDHAKAVVFKRVVAAIDKSADQAIDLMLDNDKFARQAARAAIEALREPSDPMITAAVQVIGGWGDPTLRVKISSIYQAMIDYVIRGDK